MNGRGDKFLKLGLMKKTTCLKPLSKDEDPNLLPKLRPRKDEASSSNCEHDSSKPDPAHDELPTFSDLDENYYLDSNVQPSKDKNDDASSSYHL